MVARNILPAESAIVCFFVLYNRPWFNRVPGAGANTHANSFVIGNAVIKVTINDDNNNNNNNRDCLSILHPLTLAMLTYLQPSWVPQ
jgi:hypothetical protein